MNNEYFLSLGLDIGTTTTHLVISRMSIGPGEDPFGRYHLVDKEIVHRGGIHRTPLIDETTIDALAVGEIVEREYLAAGVCRADILTGAVIVTGETARKSNAHAVIEHLAGETSTFAAAVAGANQESVLAGRGSGAAEWSRRHHACVLNVDIGGGTTNLAWFENGQLLETAAIRVGGRHLVQELPGTPHEVNDPRGLTPSADHYPFRILTTTAGQFFSKAWVTPEEAQRWIAECTTCCRYALEGRFDLIPEPFVITRPQAAPPRPSVVFFSGGVGELMSRRERGRPIEDIFADTGLMLADALLADPRLGGYHRQYPPEPIRATVIGAGQFAMRLSGETVWVDYQRLPLPNLSVLRPFATVADLEHSATMAAAIKKHRLLHDLDEGQTVAIALPSLRRALYDDVVRIGVALAHAARAAELAEPWVFVLSDNYGRLLGESIHRNGDGASFMVVDELDVPDADYLDIGLPFQPEHPVVPVIAKTLIFQ
ncbi:MAG: hypothetical protein GXY44_15855 [Phycisphaerales bacterium]|nr:hypothetical protein [Phycisphaerales bacterium]